MRVVFSGGGTLGSVSPLLAVAEELRKKDAAIEFLWIGTRNGPEKKLVGEYNIPFKSIIAGKWRRYFSLENILDLFKFGIGFLQSFLILRKFRADIFISAGSFVSVPVAIAAAFFKIPILIHQQDVVVGLANKLISPLAQKITVSLDVSLRDFPPEKTQLIGNPVRSSIFLGDKEKVFKKFNFKKDLPIVLVMGGGTGAMAINELVKKSLSELVKFCQIIHLTGKGKQIIKGDSQKIENYYPIEFVTSEIYDFYAAADLIVSRAGMSSLSEICSLGKPSIVIPIPNSHQEKNAEYFAEKGAVKVFRQPANLSFPDLIGESNKIFLDRPKPITNIDQGLNDDKIIEFVKLVKELLFNRGECEEMSRNAKKIMPRDAAQKMARIIDNLFISL